MAKKLNDIMFGELEPVIHVFLRNGYKIVVEKDEYTGCYNIFVLGEFDFNE